MVVQRESSHSSRGSTRARAIPSEGVARLLEELGLEADSITPLMELKHGITRFAIQLSAYECRLSQATRPFDFLGLDWVAEAELKATPLPAPHRRIADVWSADGR